MVCDMWTALTQGAKVGWLGKAEVCVPVGLSEGRFLKDPWQGWGQQPSLGTQESGWVEGCTLSLSFEGELL